MGHNAPAGQHKTNRAVYDETFLLSNITPQEMVFNSGLWVLMENWCKQLARNTKLYNIKVFTGSVPSEKDSNFNDVKMNVPQKMFKIICFNDIDNPNVTFMEIFIANNTPYYVNSKSVKFEFTNFILNYKSMDWFQKFTGINIIKLLNYYGFNSKKIRSFKKHISTTINLSPALRLLMAKSNWFGYLIYAKNINQLDSKWKELQQFENEFGGLKFHKQFYELVRNRMISTKHPNISISNHSHSKRQLRKTRKYRMKSKFANNIIKTMMTRVNTTKLPNNKLPNKK
jgi:hypothetical protein